MFGVGRHRVYFEPGQARLHEPIMDRACSACGLGLPGKNPPGRPSAMTIGDRDRLLRRIRQIRRSSAAREHLDSDTGGPQPDGLQALEARVAHLEQQLEGLQDSVHRESERHATLIAELQAQVEPGAMRAALAENARHRGL